MRYWVMQHNPNFPPSYDKEIVDHFIAVGGNEKFGVIDHPLAPNIIFYCENQPQDSYDYGLFWREVFLD